MDRRSQLVGLLRRYRPPGADEALFRQQMLALLATDGDPFSRRRFAPGHFTASAFVLAPSAAAQEPGLLMIHHASLQRWLQPGGHVEPNDGDLCAAALREVREETGLSELAPIPQPAEVFDLDVHPIPERGDQPRHLHLDVRFLFQAASSELSPATDASEARWVAPGEAARLNHEPAMARVLDKLRAVDPSGMHAETRRGA